MKVWLLYSHNYDFCNQFDTLLGIYDSEEKAVLAQIDEEKDPKYLNRSFGEVTDWTTIFEDCVK